VAQPEWTEHDVSDPGITLLQAFPFLGEQLDFRNPQGRRRLMLLGIGAVGLFWLLRRGDG
jgi:hypothetical protein